MKNIKTITTAIVLLFAVTMTFARTTITMEKDGGVYKVPCVVNGLRMKFIFDTGAANVCISESMATYMLENDYLNKSDILGTGLSSVADGRIVDHVKIRLSTLEIGGIKLYDVEAVVITGQSSPLLLGQSAITKIGKVSINGNQIIIEDAGGCSQADIDEWVEKAETYFKREVYAKALEYYLKVDDCDFLSDWGRYRLANCYHELVKYEQALEVYESLIRKIDNRTTELKFLDQVVLYINAADCYRRAGNIKASIYHNQIDAIGDNAATENEVFAASQEAIDEITKLTTRLIDGANFTRVIITADHGYIYKKGSLDDSSKVDLDTISAFYKNRRFLLTSEETDILGTKCLSLDYINNYDVYVTVPKGVDVFKLKGAGLNYVHGGLSLEEVIVPVIGIKSKQGGKNQRTVELQLISSNNKITNYDTMLTFFQKENISKTVLPLEASIYFEDDDGNKISNEVIIFADRNSEYAEDRQFKEKFTLKRMSYSKDKKYYLIVKDGQTDLEVNRFEFMIDIAFQDGFDFF